MKSLFKKIAVFLFVCLAVTTHGLAQYIWFTRSNNGTNGISVPSGETWKLVTYSFVNGTGNAGCIIYAGTGSPSDPSLGSLPATDGLLAGLHGGSSGYGSGSAIGLEIPGPAFLKINESTGPYLMVFKKSAEDANQGLESTSILLPESENGDVEIKLEQSADNVTWTECLPGTYNSSTVKRFFRLRAVEK
jgi:hypothetical protein